MPAMPVAPRQECLGRALERVERGTADVFRACFVVKSGSRGMGGSLPGFCGGGKRGGPGAVSAERRRSLEIDLVNVSSDFDKK